MAQVTGAFQYDIDHLLGGRARVLFAPTTEPLPGDISDLVDMTSPYAVNGSWEDLGATRDAASYSRSIGTEGYEIQQATGLVLEEITEVSRQLQVSIAEIKPEHLHDLVARLYATTAAVRMGNRGTRCRYISL